ncbi:hypothetical protein Cgig2_002186 [Carnegiea gigantea]|uniref:Uncharacterized protein n=1 Tax=Carnegiea gigantea TaxID=171969 RepID=A0A9Q1KX91_9CARY|nr:hypothetical protein Cgig2_002186 [Carnegiea gigantea]
MEAIGIRVWGYVEDRAAGNHEKRGSEGRMKVFHTDVKNPNPCHKKSDGFLIRNKVWDLFSNCEIDLIIYHSKTRDFIFAKIMGEETNHKLSLKLLVDTRANKVLFAEADKGFVDFLFHIMLLPIGTIVRLLKMKDDKIGCLGDLYKSIEALSASYIHPNVPKDMVLKPTISSCPPNFLLVKDGLASQTGTRKFYMCSYYPSSHYSYVSDAPGAVCPSCNHAMSSEVSYVAPKSSKSNTAASTDGYVKGVVTYMVMDNLEVKPMSTISSLALMNKFHVKDITSLMEKHVQVGFDEAIRILKASLENQNVLTTDINLFQGPGTVTLKPLADTKAHVVLFAEAGKDSVDSVFRFSLPTATMAKLLTKKGMVGSLGNLYKSIKVLRGDYIQPTMRNFVLIGVIISSITYVKLPFFMLNDASPLRSMPMNYYCCPEKGAEGCGNCNTTGPATAYAGLIYPFDGNPYV